MATAEIVDPDDKETLGIERPAGTHQVVPPTRILRIVGISAGDVVVAGERVTHQDGVGFGGIERTVGFVNQVVGRHHGAAPQFEWRGEMGALRRDDAYIATHIFTQEKPDQHTRIGLLSLPSF